MFVPGGLRSEWRGKVVLLKDIVGRQNQFQDSKRKDLQKPTDCVLEEIQRRERKNSLDLKMAGEKPQKLHEQGEEVIPYPTSEEKKRRVGDNPSGPFSSPQPATDAGGLSEGKGIYTLTSIRRKKGGEKKGSQSEAGVRFWKRGRRIVTLIKV